MRSKLVSAVSASLFVSLAAPAGAGTLAIYEGQNGAPGVTAAFPGGSGLIADLDYDASTAEGGSLELPPTGITILPLGDAVLVSFTCQVSGCDPGDFIFTAGGQGVGSLVLDDFSGGPVFGVSELGDLTWDSASLGSLHLSTCDYTAPAGDTDEYSCDPFTIAATPEPGTGALLGLALAALGVARRRRS